MPEAKILVVDDEKLIRFSLEKELTKEGYEVITADSGEDCLKLVKEELPDLVLLDIHLPGINGMDILKIIKEIDRDTLVIMITAYGAVETAVRAMKLGAYDFVEKPFNMEKIKVLIKKALETVKLKREVSDLRRKQRITYGFDNILGQSEGIKKVIDLAKKIARSDATTILLQGESGTGKDLVAKVIHYQSARAEKPFMEINCTALPETLIESELFGHEKGAFTDAKTLKKGLFELADGGTVYLDEIGDTKPSTQAKLLRVIEDKTFKRIGGTKDIRVDVRVMAATNKNIEEAVKSGSFREDLYYRLKVIPIHLPPLRERREDILPLANYLIKEFNREFRKKVEGIAPMAQKFLTQYFWPGNVRELRNVIERAILLESEDIILAEHLPVEIMVRPTEEKQIGGLSIRIPRDGLSIDDVERNLIKQALDITHGNQTKAARLLNISRDALRYRIQKFKLQ
jgi:DNA-binding NtrC family response regulator